MQSSTRLLATKMQNHWYSDMNTVSHVSKTLLQNHLHLKSQSEKRAYNPRHTHSIRYIICILRQLTSVRINILKVWCLYYTRKIILIGNYDKNSHRSQITFISRNADNNESLPKQRKQRESKHYSQPVIKI
jgi:hypothetical protein